MNWSCAEAANVHRLPVGGTFVCNASLAFDCLTAERRWNRSETCSGVSGLLARSSDMLILRDIAARLRVKARETGRPDGAGFRFWLP